ncbi:MAG: hypothetical protein ACE5DX_03450 [Candidatus Dojkabacteria bacterium]
MTSESSTVNILKPLEGLIIPLHSPGKEEAIREKILEGAQHLLYDEEDLTGRAGFLIHTMTLLGRLSLPTISFSFPQHFMPAIHNTFLVIPERGSGIPSGLVLDHLRQANEGERSRGIVYLASGSPGVQFRAAEHSIALAPAARNHDAKIVVVFPLEIEQMTFREISPPAAMNGVLSTTPANRITRENLTRFLMQNTPFAEDEINTIRL